MVLNIVRERIKMKKLLSINPLFLTLTLVLSPSLQAEVFPTDAAIPPAAKSCVRCHEANGDTGAFTMPRISFLSKKYLLKELKDFRGKLRIEDQSLDFMLDYTLQLSDSDIDVIAAYFTSRTWDDSSYAWGPVDLIAKGKKYYENGIPEKNVDSCTDCHGDDGEGGKGPRLADQHTDYLNYQFAAFKHDTRKNSTYMTQVAKQLSEEEVNCISVYLESINTSAQVK